MVIAAAISSATVLAGPGNEFRLAARREIHREFLKGKLSKAVTWIKFSSDGRRLLTASHDELFVWEVPAMRPVFRLDVHDPLIQTADLSLAGTLVLASDATRILRVWQVGEAQALWSTEGGDGFAAAVFDPSGSKVLIAKRDDRVAQLRDARTGKKILEITDPSISTANFAPDGETFLTGGSRGILNIWSVRTGEHILAVDPAGTRQVAFSPTGDRLVYNATGFARLVDTRVGERLGTTESEIRSDSQVANIMAIAYAPNGRSFATAVEDNARIWDASTCQPLTPPLKAAGVMSLSYSPDARWLATGSGGSDSCAVWEVGTGRREQVIRDHPISATRPSVAFSAAGKYLAVNFGSTVELWEYGE